MNKIEQLMKRRQCLWSDAKKYLDEHRHSDGLVDPEDLEIYDKMTDNVIKLGEEIDRLVRQLEIDRLIDAPVEKRIAIERCPWCGSAGVLTQTLFEGFTNSYSYYVVCSNPNCKAEAPTGRYGDIAMPAQVAKQKAIEAWNKRA